MKNNVAQFKKCSICGACVNVCPVEAIHIQKGSLYYLIDVDEKKCIECGQCLSACPVNSPSLTQRLYKGYAGYVDDQRVLYGSSSGGVFYAIAQLILEKGGVVYGAVFSDDFRSVIFKNTDEAPLWRLQKSKYVESNVGKTFQKVKSDLLGGRHVLFCGTPCQVAGLKRFLGSEFEKLITCDFSCGGLPSHKIYIEYLEGLEKKYHSEVEFVDFRPKVYGWNSHSIYINFKNGKCYSRLASLDPYFRAFLGKLSQRDYCYQCDFASNHASDIILADYWRYKDCLDFDNHNRGLSLVLTNSDKGEQILDLLVKRVSIKEIPLEKATYNISNKHSTQETIKRHYLFLYFYRKDGLVAAICRTLPSSLPKYCKQWLKQICKRGKYEGSEENRT